MKTSELSVAEALNSMADRFRTVLASAPAEFRESAEQDFNRFMSEKRHIEQILGLQRK